MIKSSICLCLLWKKIGDSCFSLSWRCEMFTHLQGRSHKPRHDASRSHSLLDDYKSVGDVTCVLITLCFQWDVSCLPLCVHGGLGADTEPLVTDGFVRCMWTMARLLGFWAFLHSVQAAAFWETEPEGAVLWPHRSPPLLWSATRPPVTGVPPPLLPLRGI